jgi:energy-coupling factor transport system permease protein
LQLAASMDARGYGRRAEVSARSRRVTAALVLGGLMGLVVGLYGLLDAGSPSALGLPLALTGGLSAAVGFRLAGRRSIRTRYRPDPWRGPEWVTFLAGALPAAVLIAARTGETAGMLVPSSPLAWPTVPLVPALAILVGLVPAWATPLQEPATEPRAEPADGRLPREVAA